MTRRPAPSCAECGNPGAEADGICQKCRFLYPLVDDVQPDDPSRILEKPFDDSCDCTTCGSDLKGILPCRRGQ